LKGAGDSGTLVLHVDWSTINITQQYQYIRVDGIRDSMFP
jgi:hypothetical protein